MKAAASLDLSYFLTTLRVTLALVDEQGSPPGQLSRSVVAQVRRQYGPRTSPASVI
jgi:hypothetical protein